MSSAASAGGGPFVRVLWALAGLVGTIIAALWIRSLVVGDQTLGALFVKLIGSVAQTLAALSSLHLASGRDRRSLRVARWSWLIALLMLIVATGEGLASSGLD